MTETPEQLASFAYVWRWNTQLPPPINGQFRTDSRDWAAATHVMISNVTDAGANVSSGLSQITAGSTLTMAMQTDATRNAKFTVTASVAQSGYYDVTVTKISTAGTLPNSSTSCTLSIDVPVANFSITWKVSMLTGRPNRFTLTCSCPHGSVSELCATRMGSQPVPPQATIEATAQNLLRATGCNCAGLVAGALAQADGAPGVEFDEIFDGVGL